MSETSGGHDFGNGNAMVLLAQLRTEMIYQKELTRDNAALLGQVADDVTEIKIKMAGNDGKKEGLLSGAKILNIIIILIASVATAWGTVKAMAVSMVSPPH